MGPAWEKDDEEEMGDSGWEPGAARPGPSLWESAWTWSRPLANRIHGTTPNKIHWAVIIGSDPLCGVRSFVLRWEKPAGGGDDEGGR